GHVDGQRVRTLVEIHAAVGRAAVVFDLEREAGVACSVGVGGGGEHQQSAVDVADGHELAGGDCHAVVGQRAGAGERGDLDRQQRVGRGVAKIVEPEVGGGDRVGGVFQRGDVVVFPTRRSSDLGHVDGQRVRALVEIHAAVGRAAVVLDLECEAGIACPVGV